MPRTKADVKQIRTLKKALTRARAEKSKLLKGFIKSKEFVIKDAEKQKAKELDAMVKKNIKREAKLKKSYKVYLDRAQIKHLRLKVSRENVVRELAAEKKRSALLAKELKKHVKSIETSINRHKAKKKNR